MESNKNLTAQESLDIITGMINQAKGNVKNNSFYFLLWGWVVAIANLGMYVLIQVNYSKPYLIWLLVVPAWIISMYTGFKKGRETRNVTHLDRVNAALWISFGIVVFTLIAFGYKINYQLNPLILLITSIPTLISGVILKFKPLIIGGILFWIFAIINFTLPIAYQNLIGAVAIISGYLIPGYMLKRKSQE